MLQDKLARSTFSGFIYLLSASGIQVFLKIGVLAILARIISPRDFGLAGIAIIIVEFSKLFTQMGVGPAIVQRKELEDRHLTTGFTLSLCMGVLFAGFLFLAASTLEVFFRMEGLAPVLQAISVVFFVDSTTLIGQAQLQRNMKFKLLAALEVMSYAIGYGAVGISLGYLGMGVWALVIANISQAVLYAALVMIVQPFSKRPGFNYNAFKELIHFGAGHTLARIGNYLAIQGDNLVVGRTLGAASLGIYGRAYQFMVMPSSLFGNTLDKVLFPAMSKVQDDKQKLVKAYLTGTSLIALIAIPISVLFVFLAPEIILSLLGPQWKEVIDPFRILACSLLFRMSYKMSDSLARATGAVYKRAWRQLLYAGAVFLSSYIGHFWGLNGVAWGVALTLVGNFFMMSQLSNKLIGSTWLDLAKAHTHGVLLGITTGVFSYFIVNISRQFNAFYITLLCTGIGVIVLLCLVIWAFPSFFIRNDHKALVEKLILKRFKKISLEVI
ncbi:lipopolysaccharide biosynthesis protein [Segetibacter aerophilus]|uniref:Lipopolysaccharide biosynthesis protein n=1 Tax=Segetibacter aerophilus TaxID=670293 RepID=A0A512B887_9BACT|nr:lipopolysaccharide biosynthesis protein [Segetibacter aerophilus]GEO08175.1 lipopolysaccharide biosynthesis protein [Segetibacter aerophilus]